MSISWIALAMVQVAQPVTDASEIIIVRGKVESARTVPAGVVKVDPQNILTVDDVATAVPGVWIVNDQDPGTNILSIRGATTDRLQQASVAFILDGVPLADTELFTPRLFDVAQVEVLKGPQGALYGKNAAGGVLAITTEGARDDGRINDSGQVLVRVGNGGLAEAEISKSLALSDTWAVRGAAVWTSAEGWIHNTTLNKKVDGSRTQAIRLGAMGAVLGFDIDVRAHWLEEKGGAAWASSNNVTGKNNGRLSGAVLINPIGDYEGRAARRWAQTSARVGRAFATGRFDLLVARDSYQKRWSEELDYRPGALTFFGFPAFPNGIQPISQPIDIAATTLQARWTSDLSGPLNFQIGAFAQDTDKDRVDDFGPLLFGGPPSAYATNSRQGAVFGGIEWRPNDAWLLEVQGRFDSDNRSQSISNARTGVLIERRAATFERVQPRIASSYQFSDQVTGYFSYGEAFRPGGFNPVPAPNSIWKAAFRPEITTSFEAGAKMRNLPLSGQLDFAAFSNNVTDFQNYTFIDNQSVTLNVDEVLVKGFEVSGTMMPAAYIKAGAAYALTAGEIQRFIATDPLLGSPATRNYTGKSVPNAPRDTAKVWVEWSPRISAATVTIRLDANYAGTTFYEIDNVLRSPSRVWGDMNLIVEKGSWTLSFKAENITDERWAISAFGQGMTGLLAGLGPNGPFDTFTINRGRRLSLSLKRYL